MQQVMQRMLSHVRSMQIGRGTINTNITIGNVGWVLVEDERFKVELCVFFLKR